MRWEATMSWVVYSHFHEDRGVILARVIGVALSLILIGLPAVQAQDRAFQFGLMGDTGYTAEDIEGFKGLLAAVNGADLSLWSMLATSKMTDEHILATRLLDRCLVPTKVSKPSTILFNRSGIRSF
jgi:hypothetical protein